VTALVPPEWFGARGGAAKVHRGAGGYVNHLIERAPLVAEVTRS
jgi:hypothetical protein